MHHFDLDIGKKSKKNKFPEESNQRSLARLSLSPTIYFNRHKKVSATNVC
jgi:hypothetical protein